MDPDSQAEWDARVWVLMGGVRWGLVVAEMREDPSQNYYYLQL